MDETRKGTCNETPSCLTAHEPTEAMIRAGQDASDDWIYQDTEPYATREETIYRAMEAARVGEKGRWH